MYWINTISLDHVMQGVNGGFTQAGHGKAGMIKNLSDGDYIIFYSPRTSLNNGEPLQEFTAAGRITDTEPYQATVSESFHPWRRRVNFLPCRPVSIRPLIESLEFIKDKKKWGYPFRRGLFQINRKDFELITKAMEMKLPL